MWFRTLLLCLYVSVPCPLLAQEQHVLGFGGINNQDDSMMIADGDAIDVKNVLTDEGDIRTIYGNIFYATVGNSSITFQQEFISPAGGRVLFVKSGSSLYASNPDTGEMTVIHTFSEGYEPDMVSAFGKAYFVDGSTTPFNTIGASTSASTGFEDCKYTEFYQNRLLCVNTSTDTSKIKLSGYNTPAEWAVTSSKDSGAVKYYKKDDGYQINCVFTTPAGVFIGKDRSAGILKGSDNETFYWVDISNDIGCVDDRTVQMVDGELVWLSQNGYYGYDFSSVPRLLSRKITATTKQIRRSGSADLNWLTNTKAVWGLGTGAGWDYEISPGSIKSKTYNSGVLTGGTTTFARMFAGAGFEANITAYTPLFQYTCSSGYPRYPGVGQCAIVGNDAGISMVSAEITTPHIKILNAADLVLISSAALNSGTWNNFSVGGTGDIKIAYTNTVNTTHTSPAFDRVSGVSVYYVRQGNPGYDDIEIFDTRELGNSVTTEVSAVRDAELISPPYALDFKGTNARLNWYYSGDNSSWLGPVVVTSVTSPYNTRYWKYSVTLSSGVDVSSFTSVRLSVFSTSTYVSPVKFTAVDISRWKLFSVADSATAVTPSYFVRTASYAFAAGGDVPSWVAQPSNTTVAASTNTYVQYKLNPNLTSSTQSVTVVSVNLAYAVGSLSPRAASVLHDHRYISAVSLNSATENDITIIYQKNKEWTFSKDVGYGSLGLYNNRPMAGSATSNSKLWYILDSTATTFDGLAIDSYWITKDYAFGVLNNHKVLNRLWLTAENNGLANFGVAWQKNRDGVWNSTYTSLAAASFIVREVEGLFDGFALGRQFRFKFTGNELDKYFRMKLFSVYYTVNPLIKDPE